MLTRRPATERGKADFGWLKSRHTFSFGHYYDQDFMGFGSLRVINEDRVAPGRGFDTHGHRNMEIISYVLEGALEHKDSLGTGSVIRAGDVQRMTAGTGVRHSEFNASSSDPVHFLQIWILPAEDELAPGYEQKFFPEDDKRNVLRLIGSEDGSEGSVRIHQDVRLYASSMTPGATLTTELAPTRCAWLQVVRGSVRVNDIALEQGDGLAITKEQELSVTATTAAEFLLFDMEDRVG